jgi:hypothetical protein
MTVCHAIEILSLDGIILSKIIVFLAFSFEKDKFDYAV